MSRWKDRLAVESGAATGIGKAVAARLAAESCICFWIGIGAEDFLYEGVKAS